MLISLFYLLSYGDKNTFRPVELPTKPVIFCLKSVRTATPMCIKPNLKDGKGKVMGYISQKVGSFFSHINQTSKRM